MCSYMFIFVFLELLISLYELLYFIKAVCQVSWSLEVKRPWRLKVLLWNDHVCLCMLRRVLRVCFWLNWCGRSKIRIKIFSSLKCSIKSPQGPSKVSWGRTLYLSKRGLDQTPIDWGKWHVVVHRTPYWWVSWEKTYNRELKLPNSCLWTKQREGTTVQLWTNSPSTPSLRWYKFLHRFIVFLGVKY